MRDNGSREQLADALELVPGVKDVAVDLYRAHARMIHGPPRVAGDLVSIVAQVGYGAAVATNADRAADVQKR
jgi:hypothetical protein